MRRNVRFRVIKEPQWCSLVAGGACIRDGARTEAEGAKERNRHE